MKTALIILLLVVSGSSGIAEEHAEGAFERNAEPAQHSRPESPVSSIKYKTKAELVSVIHKASDPTSAEARAALSEIFHRLSQEPVQRIGFVLSPDMMRKIQKEVVMKFINSPEGRDFIWNNRDAFLSPSSGEAGNVKPLYKSLGEALEKWDAKNAKAMDTLGITGTEVDQALQQLRKELGGKILTLGLFLPDGPMEEMVNEAMNKAAAYLIPEIRRQASAKAAAEVEQKRRDAHDSHLFFHRRIDRTANAAKPQAKQGAMDGAEHAVQGIDQPQRNNEYYLDGYYAAQNEVSSKLSTAKSTMKNSLEKALEHAFDPNGASDGVNIDVVQAAPFPRNQGSFPRDEQTPGFADKPYFALYDRTVKPDGRVSRDTYMGWYADKIDKKTTQAVEALSSGKIGQWANQFVTK